ncbi:MAG: type II toxin-antitoxin system HicA family toxin [Dehalococcoidia bacterium]
MGKLAILSGRDVCRRLERHGFREMRQRGSHLIMQRRTQSGTISVPVPNHRELAAGTLASIVRQSGLPRELFEQ